MSIDNADDLDWRADAACLEHDPEVFFPEKGHGSRLPKLICASCPVVTRAICLEVNLFEADGVFGGMSARERMKFRVAEGLTFAPGQRGAA